MATEERLPILKTYKLFIDGKFPRTESGRVLPARSKSGKHLGNYCHGSRKDARDAVVAARRAQPGWAGSSAYLKGQILYRLAEMLEGRAAVFATAIAEATGVSRAAAEKEVTAAVDQLVYFAGWTDKIQQVFGAVNPVASPHFNFTVLEPTGVVVLIAPDTPCLLGAVHLLASAIAGGNACVLLASELFPLPLIELAEVVATSDVPAGVVNILTGPRMEMVKPLSKHMDVNAMVDASGDAACGAVAEAGTALNMKRVQLVSAFPKDPELIVKLMEAKTAWHPMGV